MALLFTNNDLLFAGEPATTFATVFRGTPPVAVYGPVAVNVQTIDPQMPASAKGGQLSGKDGATHTLYLDWTASETNTFQPLYGTDYIFVTGQRDNRQNGYYALVSPVLPDIETEIHLKLGFPNIDGLELRCRYTGASMEGDLSAGDTGETYDPDNSGNLWIGGGRGATG